MNNQEIVNRLWSLCDTLRDSGITYQDYLTELTYILFLKMCKETGREEYIPEEYRWDNLLDKSGIELKTFYVELLNHLGQNTDSRIREIYKNSSTSIREPKNLEKIIQAIDKVDWYDAREEGLGNLYEGLLEKNATEKKSGAGQYFTPRPLINVMTELIAPQPGERCNDPACGTFGFMIAADRYIKSKTDELFNLSTEEQEFQKNVAFSGCELVFETHRLALMNAMLHDINGEIFCEDTLSPFGERMKGYDVVLTNPPFGTKKGGESASRSDFVFVTSNKQFNFLQHIYRSLNTSGHARAAVVVPDNILFAQDNAARAIRKDLMEKCNLHTILRLPKGIFYARGVQTNVLFFTRGEEDHNNTKEVWFYDARTNVKHYGQTVSLEESDLSEFVSLYKDGKIEERSETYSENNPEGRWRKYSYEEIKENEGLNLDYTWLKEEDGNDDRNVIELISDMKEMSGEISKAVDRLYDMLKEVKIE